MSWRLVRTCGAVGDMHILPINDLMEHIATRQCLCHPFVEETSLRSFIVHHAADGREHFEADHDEDDSPESVS